MNEDALICDLAETYHIYDYRQLPALRVAVFSMGLREDSRMKLLLSGQKISLEQMLLAGIADRLSILIWQKTKDGQNNRNRPKSLYDMLTAEKRESQNEVYNSGEEFEKARLELLREIGGEEEWQQN